MNDVETLNNALTTLKPVAQAIVDLADNMSILANVESLVQQAQGEFDVIKTKTEKAEASLTATKEAEAKARADAIAMGQKAEQVLTDAKAQAQAMIDTARRDATAMAEDIKAQYVDEIRTLGERAQQARDEYAELTKATEAARREHDAVLTSIQSLKSRLG